jgi:hypothetical protein
MLTLPGAIFEMTKLPLTLSLSKPRKNAEGISHTFELFVTLLTHFVKKKNVQNSDTLA